MPDDLYFIPILAHALQQPGPESALQQAFAEIERLGRQPEYRQGYDQFQRFMTAAAEAHVRLESAERGVRKLMVELATGGFEGEAAQQRAALGLIRSRPEWKAEYEQLCAEMRETSRPLPLEITVTREDQLVGTIAFDRIPGCGSISNVTPGRYTLALATGRVIWQGVLTEQDLVWREAFPGRPLDLAADTGEDAKPTLEVPLLDGELTMRVLPGLESGRIEITATVR